MTTSLQQAYPRPAWLIIVLAIAPRVGLGICRLAPRAIAMMTVAFGRGQSFGPIATGAITDVVGNLSYGLNVSAAVLVAGVVACMTFAASQREQNAPSYSTQAGRRA
jgi:hypothetical protein